MLLPINHFGGMGITGRQMDGHMEENTKTYVCRVHILLWMYNSPYESMSTYLGQMISFFFLQYNIFITLKEVFIFSEQ